MERMPQAPQTGWRQAGTDAAAPGVGHEGLPGPMPGWYRALPPWIREWAPPLTLAALAISFFAHLVFWGIAAVVIVGGAQAGGGGGGGQETSIGVAVITEAELGALQSGSLDAETPAVAEAPSVALPGGETDLHVADALAGGGIDPGNLGAGAGSLTTGLGAGDISGGPGLGVGGAGGGAASFFGVEARGTRFAYIVDISGSMDELVGSGNLRRIDLMKLELGRSIEALLENARFFIVTFSTDSKPLGGRLEWTAASDAGKAWARKTIPLVQSEASTEPFPAFELVLKAMRPKPDAIYFMTDGEFDKDVAGKILRLNTERIPIHCITFISREGEEVMKRIAADSKGTYSHVPGPGR
jgi:hypothetical protein